MKKYLSIVSLLMVFILYTGCGGGGGSSSSTTDTNIENPVENPVVGVVQKIFTINAYDTNKKQIKLISYKVKLNGNEITNLNTQINKITLNLDSDLKIGDVIDVEIEGYTPQQFKITQDELNKNSVNLYFKAVESRQTYTLADLIYGGDSVTPQSARGAKTVIDNDSVKFKMLNGKVELSIPINTYKRIIRKIARLPKSTEDTKVYLDITSIDPKLEYNATIGDFTYNDSTRSTQEVTDEDNGLESVTMADISMSTSEGDEIHCFGGGNYDEQTGTCDDNTYASLKMKIPASQFKEYSQKYNEGDRVVPLYYYNKAESKWVRQVDSSGNPIDGTLVLVDNNNNNIADEGDDIYIEGKVGHFSWWNGDYPLDTTCLHVNVEPNEDVSFVQVKGIDYVGRIFKVYIDKDTKSVDIKAKKNALVEVSLVMKDGGIADKFDFSTGDSKECTDTNETLKADTLDKGTLNVNISDEKANPISSCYVYFDINDNLLNSKSTDSEGHVEFGYSYNPDLNIELNATVSVYCNVNGASFNDKKSAPLPDTKDLNFTFNTEVKHYTGNVYEVIDNIKKPVANAYVEIYNNTYGDTYFYNFAETDENGTFDMPLLSAKIEQDSDKKAYIYISFYDKNYGKYISLNKEINLTSENLGDFYISYTTTTVTGRVLDTLGNPINGAKVYASNNDTYSYTTTDNSGTYKMILLGSNELNTSIYATVYKGTYLYSDTKYFLTDTNKTVEENLIIDLRKATIKGKLLTKKGLPVPNVTIYWNRDWYNYGITDENGSFEIDTYKEGDGYLYAYNKDTYETVDINESVYSKRYVVNGVKKGQITDLGNIIVNADNYPPTITSVTFNPENPKVSDNFEIIINATDPDGDDLNYKLTSSGWNSDNISISQDETNNNVFNITAAKSGYYYFTVTVSDGKNTVTKNISVYVQDHSKPIIRSVEYTFPNNKSYYDKSQDVNIVVNAYSEEGNALDYQFELTNYSTGETIQLQSNGNTATLTTDIPNGYYKLKITVSDAYNKVYTYRYFTVDDTVAPEINQLLLNNKSTTNIYLTKPSNESINLNIFANLKDNKVSNPTWFIYINGQSIKESGTEINKTVTLNNSGTYYGYVSVRDDQYRNDYKYFTVTVADNLKPVIRSITVNPSSVIKSTNGFVDKNGNNITEINVSVDAYDPENETLTYSFGTLNNNTPLKTSANWAVYEITGMETGKYAIEIKISDGTNTVNDFAQFEIEENKAPIITQMYVPSQAKAGKTIDLYASAYDPNNDEITYHWEVNNGTLENENSKEAKLTLPDEGNVTVTLTVSDGEHNVAKTKTVEVIKNQPPIIQYLGIENSVVSDSITLKAYYYDTDGYIESAVYKINDQEYTATYGETQIDVSNLDDGNYTVTLIVTDDNGATNSKTLSFTVKRNHAPIITDISLTPNGTVLIGEKVQIDVVADDPDGDAVNIQWSADKGELIVDPEEKNKALFSADTAGVYTVTVWAVDQNGLKSEIQKIEIYVSTANINVTVSSPVLTNKEVNLSAELTNENNESLSYDSIKWELVNKPENSTITLTSDKKEITLIPDVAGTYSVKVTITRNGIAYTKTVSFTAQDENTADTLQGTVTDENGNILSGVLVRLYNKDDASLYDEKTTTDENGQYIFTNVPNGTYYLVVYAGDGYIKQTKIITINN